MKMESLMEEFKVPALEEGYITGDLVFSNLINKNKFTKYPVYDVLIANPRFMFNDAKFENALRSKIFKSKYGDECIKLVFKDYGKHQYLPIKGHAEGGKTTTADQLLIIDDYPSYLSNNQRVLACVKSYSYDNQYGSGVTHSLAFIEIDSIEHPKIS